jgi:Rrf2 family iron-sulfur cluster assembly transcriptional regulator
MKLSTKSRYGTRLLLDLAIHDTKNFVQLKEISKRQGISLKYLEQIIIPLKKARLVESSRGATGGYRLAKPPDRISVGEIVALLEGGKFLSRCESHPESCERSESCSVRNIWKEATQAMYDKLNGVSLADLVLKEKLL